MTFAAPASDSAASVAAAPTTAAPQAYYVDLGDGRYLSTEHTQGAWSHGQQHMGPISGLLTHAIETCSPRDDLAISRLTFDILGVIPMGQVAIEAHVVRPGRTIELVRAEMSAAGRVVVRATAWRLAVTDTASIAGSAVAAMPGPDAGAPWRGADVWDGGFIRTLDFRVLPGWQPGRGRVWLRTDTAIVADAEVSPLSRYLGLVDTANGIAVRADPATLLFPNTDLTVHLLREPVGDWVGLDTTVSFGAGGIGLTSSVLHDINGPIGRASQTLTLRPTGDIAAMRTPSGAPLAT